MIGWLGGDKGIILLLRGGDKALPSMATRTAQVLSKTWYLF